MPPIYLKLVYSEKATKFCEISTLLLSYLVPVKSKMEISQNFVAFSEYMNFNVKTERKIVSNFCGLLRINELQLIQGNRRSIMQGSIVLAIKNDCIFWLVCNCIFGILCCINRLRSTVFQLFFLTNAEETTKQINKSSIYTTAKCNPSCKSPSQQTFWCRMSIIITLKTRKSIKIPLPLTKNTAD